MNSIVGDDRGQRGTDTKNQDERKNDCDQFGDLMPANSDPANEPAENIDQVNGEKGYDEGNEKVPAEAQDIINGDTNRQATRRGNQTPESAGSNWNGGFTHFEVGMIPASGRLVQPQVACRMITLVGRGSRINPDDLRGTCVYRQ